MSVAKCMVARASIEEVEKKELRYSISSNFQLFIFTAELLIIFQFLVLLLLLRRLVLVLDVLLVW